MSNDKLGGGEANSEDFKDQAFKSPLSKFDYDLFKDEDHIVMPICHVKRAKLPGNGARWKLMRDDKVILIVEGAKLNNKQFKFLNTVEGATFILQQAKAGCSTLTNFNAALKKEIKKYTIIPTVIVIKSPVKKKKIKKKA